jgi:proteasome lid subunit RPN8/RPN11
LYKTEAIVLFHYSKEENVWEMSVPAQRVMSGRILYYDANYRKSGFICAGTIHSHGSMGAFHSGIDRTDEEHWDGIHITIGDLYKTDCFSLDAEAVVNDYRVTMPLSWFEGIEELPASVDKLIFQRFKRVSPFLNTNRKYCSIKDPELTEWEVPAEWLAKVEAVTVRAWTPSVQLPANLLRNSTFGSALEEPQEQEKEEK